MTAQPNKDVMKQVEEENPEAIEPIGKETPQAAANRLAALDPLEYEQVREKEAQRLGVRVGALDKAVFSVHREAAKDKGPATLFPLVEPWPEAVNTEELLTEIRHTVKRFIVCEPETEITAALWCAFTWVIDHVQVAPLAVITAPEKRCGKSQLLTLIGRLSRRPLVASNISPSAMFRVIEAYSPTLLIDEADTFFKENEELRGVINSGHSREIAFVIRNVGDDHEPKKFGTFAAKAISGIGTLAETIMDRAVVLELRRKLPGEKVERLRHAEHGLFGVLASKLARFADDAGSAIERARPYLPEALNDRAQDNWEPLLAIADYAGGEWPKQARDAALKISGVENEALSLSAELLADIKAIFDDREINRIYTEDLIEALCADEECHWSTYNKGFPIKPRQLGKRLGEYGIASKNLYAGYKATKKGFELEQFIDAFQRYLTSAPSNPPPPKNIRYPLEIGGGAGSKVADEKANPLSSAIRYSDDNNQLTEPNSGIADKNRNSGSENLAAIVQAAPFLDDSGIADRSGIAESGKDEEEF